MPENRHDATGVEFELPIVKTGDRKRRVMRAMATSALFVSTALGLTRDNPQPDVFVVNHENSVPADGELRVITANVHSWVSPEGYNNFRHFQRAIATKELGVACLQEVRDGPEVEELVAEYNGIFATTKIDLTGRRFGNLLLSSHPLVLDRVASLPNPETDEPRNAIVADIQTTTGPLNVACIHLSPLKIEADVQSQYFESTLDDPVDIFFGDLNLEEPIVHFAGIGRSSRFGRLLSYTPVSSNVFTFPDSKTQQPHKQIDWILTSCNNFSAVNDMQNTTTTTSFNSDHKLVEVRFSVDTCNPIR